MNQRLRIAVLVLFCSLQFACNREVPPAAHHYALTGRIIAVNARDRTATVNAAAIPNYMEAMTMEYPVPAKDDFAKLHVGDRITATVDVRDDGLYSLSHIKILPPAQK